MSGPPSAAEWASAPRMNEIEALMWRSEPHPAQSSTITAVMLLDWSGWWKRAPLGDQRHSPQPSARTQTGVNRALRASPTRS